jgi:transcriptional regulator of acetoin/glycerol metabolism
VTDLPEDVRRAASGPRLTAMERAEVHLLQEALRETRGARGAAATMLGISRSTLYRKLKAYRIDPEGLASDQAGRPV